MSLIQDYFQHQQVAIDYFDHESGCTESVCGLEVVGVDDEWIVFKSERGVWAVPTRAVSYICIYSNPPKDGDDG